MLLYSSHRTPKQIDHRARRPVRRRSRPRLEVLEDRLTPATLTVNSLADNITDTSVLTLRDAIELVNNAGDPAALGQSSMPGAWSSQIAGSFGSSDTIQFDFDPSLFGAAQKTISLGGTELLLSRDVAIAGPGAGLLAVSGNRSSRVFEIAAGATATLSGLAIKDGKAPSSGGGISNSGTLTVTGSALSGNSAADNGGAIANIGTLTVTGSTLSGNRVLFSRSGFGGGGIYNGGRLTVSASTLSGNSAFTAGGGIVNDDGGTLKITDSTLSGNSAVYYGGGIYNFSDGAATVSGSTLSDNLAQFGGGIFNEGMLTVSRSILSHNSATQFGGGILNDYGAVTVSDSSLTENSAPYAGGIFNAGTMTVSRSTLSANSATLGVYGGGGIYNSSDGTLTVKDNSSICGNTAPLGADVDNDGVLYQDSSSTICVLDGNPAIMITQTGTTTAIASSSSTSMLGQVVTFTAMVGVVAPGTGNPTGTVTFLADGSTLGSGTLDATGRTTVTTAGLSVGTHLIIASYDGDAGFTGSASAPYEILVVAPVADLQVTISPTTPNTLLEGREFSYTIIVTNAGPDAATGVTVVDAQKKPIFATSTLKNGEQASFLVKKTAGLAGSYSDTFVAFAEQRDPRPADNTAIVNYVVAAATADLQVTISPVTGTVLVGQPYSYTITVTNAGPRDATGVVVLAHRADGGTSDFYPNKNPTTGGQLASGKSATFTVTQTATQAGTSIDMVDAGADQPDPDPSNNTKVAVNVEVSAVTAESLQRVVNSATPGATITLQVDPTRVGAIMAAVNGLVPSGPTVPPNPCGLVLNLAGGTYAGFTASPPAGMILNLMGMGTATLLVGQSPALTVTSGTVGVTGVTFANATAAPTVLVTGGSLTLRNDVIQETTGGKQAAIVVTGGTLDLGTTASPGGNIVNVNGPGTLIRNTGAAAVPAIGNTFQVDGKTLTSNYRVEDAIAHAPDAAGQGLVTWVPDNVYVTAASGSTQRGIDAVAAGGTVNVEKPDRTLFDVGTKLVTVRYQDGPSLSLQADPLQPGRVMLQVMGTAGDDTIRIKAVDDDPTSIRVRIKDQDFGNLKVRGAFGTPIGRIVVSGLAGDDDLKVDDDIAIAAWLYGGTGDDRLKGGAGDDVLLGGAGDDHLVGGSGRDLLIGGSGADRLMGNAGDDVLIAGYTAHDTNDLALSSIMNEWTGGQGYGVRVANLQAGTGLAGGFRLDGNDGALQTVFNDDDVDVLTGNEGTDWSLANRVADNGGPLDRVTDQAGNELWSDTDS